MDWEIALLLAAALFCAGLLVLLLREIFKAFAPTAESLDRVCLAAPDNDVRTATLLLRHSFVITMMEHYRDIGSQCDIMDFINDELCSRNASWRVRLRADGSGEFYDIKTANKLNATVWRSYKKTQRSS